MCVVVQIRHLFRIKLLNPSWFIGIFRWVMVDKRSNVKRTLFIVDFFGFCEEGIKSFAERLSTFNLIPWLLYFELN